MMKRLAMLSCVLLCLNAHAKTELLVKKVVKASKAAGINPNLSLAIVKVESNFKVKAIRYEPQLNDRSIGIFQILHSSAKGLGFRGSIKQLYNPDTNIKYGVMYLQTCSDLHDGNVKKIICCYNKGFYARSCPSRYLKKVMKEFIALNG